MHEPNAALGDAALLVTGLLIARQTLLIGFGRARWAAWLARWLRRLAVVATLVPALRLISLAIGEAQHETLLARAALAILAGGALLLALDHWLANRWRPA